MNLQLMTWNARGINSRHKRDILHDLIVQFKVDIVLIQETKKEHFSNRILNSISTRLDIWHWLPSVGRSGGILFGGDSNKIRIIKVTQHRFCLDVQMENKIDSKISQITVVYGLVDRKLKRDLWKELDSLRNEELELWVLSGDFNVIRSRSEKSGVNFDIQTSSFFNKFISKHSLVEHKIDNRKFTWSNGRNFALLDRIFTSIAWDMTYATSYIHDASKYGSDHCPLILHTSNSPLNPIHHFRFDPSWVENEEFNRLVIKWWDEFPLDLNDLCNSWNMKMKHMRKKNVKLG